jgi:hypothetical protein
VFVWVPLIAIASPPLGFVFFSPLITDNARLPLAYVIAILWYVGLGYQLRRGGASIDNEKRGSRRSPRWALPILGVSTMATLTLWAGSLSFFVFGAAQPSLTWPFTVGVVAASVALAVAAGLWRYRGFGLAQAAVAGLSICAAEAATGAALIGALMANDVPQRVAVDCWGAAVYAPVALLVLAVFDPAFRRFSTSAVLTAMFCAPHGLLVWLHDSATLPMSDATETLIFLVIFSLWLAAIGEVLRRPTIVEPHARSAKPQDEEVPGAAPSIALEPVPKPA